MLITNPANPKEGRIYLFAHQGHGQQEGQAAESFEEVRQDYTTGADAHEFPTDPEHPGQADLNGWIGRAGNNGVTTGNRATVGSGAHVHIEVYEYFADDPQIGASHGWERVNPRTVFSEDRYDLLDAEDGPADGALAIEKTLATMPGWDSTKLKRSFRPWSRWGVPDKEF